MNTGRMNAVWVLVPLVVDKPPNPADVKAGWVAFGVFIALAVAVVLLWLSFRKQLKKIDFDEEKTVRPRRGTRSSSGSGHGTGQGHNHL
jgi:hypothetical protein